MHSTDNTITMVSLTILSIYPIFDEKPKFRVNIKGYKSLDVLFLEIDNFISEYDPKLGKYLSKFDNIEDKVKDAMSIGYDFEDMITDYVVTLIEYGLIILTEETKI